jgi:hypothetical protein
MKQFRKVWRRGVYVALLALLLCSAAFAKDSTVKEKTREINIVYDDSGSMFNGTTAWSEAKYAVEVFAAMMGERDTVNIYLMSDYEHPITLQGNGNAQNNVAAINQLADCGGTPFAAVQAAGNALMTSDADDKWLVIFTDGYFEEGESYSTSGILSYVGQNSVKVVYTAIGADTVDLRGYAQEQFYPYVTENGSILSTMTEIATRVFNYQEVALSGVGTGTVSFDADIPLSKLVIFAQGDGVRVEDLQVDGSDLQGSADSAIAVQVNQASGGGAYALAASGLSGVVYTATAQDAQQPFQDGTYQFSCSTDNVKVYVEPGVSVEATLTNAYGEAVSMGSGATITEGDWTVSARIVNPLTGAVIDPSASSILSSAATAVVVTFDDGTIGEYADGDTIPVSGSAMELYARTSYQGISGTIEKTSQIYTFSVEKSPLVFTFSAPGGCELDAVMLTADQDLTFTVTLGGAPLTAEQAGKLKFDVDDTQGIQWTIQPVDDTGTFRLVPGYSSRKGLRAVTAGETTLEISAKLEKRSGTGTVGVNILTEAKTQLLLSLTLPEAQSFGTAERYMFDATLRGAPENGEARPYILVSVQVLDADGNTRLLTDEEWAAGVDCFSFDAQGVGQSTLWKLVQTLTLGGQNLETPSTYRLYLSGVSELNVLPNTSDLTVHLAFVYDNGAALQGSDSGTVTVKPLTWWRYILYFLILTAVLLLVILVVILELTKPRIPKDFRPKITVDCRLNGTPVAAVQPEHYAKFKRKYTLRPRKPEECRVRFDSRDSNLTISFTVVAAGKGSFCLGRNQLSMFSPVRHSVTFNTMTYAQMESAPGTPLETADSIQYIKRIGDTEKKVKLTF